MLAAQTPYENRTYLGLARRVPELNNRIFNPDLFDSFKLNSLANCLKVLTRCSLVWLDCVCVKKFEIDFNKEKTFT